MKKTLYLSCCVLLSGLISSCVQSSESEKYQNERDNITDVHSLVKEIPTDDVLIGSTSRLYILNNHLIIGDYKPYDKLIHIFDKNTFRYQTSIANVGQGPDEITIMGHIGTDSERHKFYVSDHGKMKIFSYDIDSVLSMPDYTPGIKTEMDMTQFPDRYLYVNDTLSIALLIKPTSASTFDQYVGKWNMKDKIFTPMKYMHPDIKKKRISFAALPEKNLYAECYAYHDLMSICDMDNGLKYNIYGPAWDAKESTKIHHYGGVVFCNDKIVASYSGGDNRSSDYAPTRFLVFNLNGDYLKTLDTGYRISDFCYDKDNNRIIMSLNDDIQFGYLDLNNLI